MSSSGPGPRSYSSGTVRALFALSGTTCYFPDCPRTVVTFVGDEPINDVDIAHIRAASPDGERYDPTMTDDERRAFANLILLCTAHHKLIDIIHPEDYPVEKLLAWKAEREAAMGIDRLNLSGINEDSLIEAIIEAIASAPPQRKVTVELGLGYFGSSGLIEFRRESAKQYLGLEMYPELENQVLILTVRNTGVLTAYWERHMLYYRPWGMAEAGFNYFPYDNPVLPYRLESGQSGRWLYHLPEVTKKVEVLRQKKLPIDTLVAKVGLGSGEDAESSPLPVDCLPD